MSLDDVPDRADAFRDALSDLSEAEINAGFELALRQLKEFPVPAEIREFAQEAARENQKRLAEESLRNQRQIEDRIRGERFDGTDAETRRREFAEMVAAAAKSKAMAPAIHNAPEVPRVIPPNIAAAKGPEWEERLRLQSEELKRRAALESPVVSVDPAGEKP